MTLAISERLAKDAKVSPDLARTNLMFLGLANFLSAFLSWRMLLIVAKPAASCLFKAFPSLPAINT